MTVAGGSQHIVKVSFLAAAPTALHRAPVVDDGENIFILQELIDPSIGCVVVVVAMLRLN